MGAYIVRRILSTILVMLIVGVCVFLLLHIAPGDPAAIIAGDYTSPANIDAIRRRLGLEDPVIVQFGRFIAHAVRFDFGISYQLKQPVTGMIA
jgi:peptide/nickel transport system permease protein